MATDVLTSSHPAPHRERTRLAALWFGLFGAPAAWSLQLLANYGLASYACFPHRVPLREPVFAGLWVVLLVISVLMIGLALAAGWTAWRSWRATREELHAGPESHHLAETGEGRTRFMAFAGMLVTLLFAYALLMQTAALFLVRPCQA